MSKVSSEIRSGKDSDWELRCVHREETEIQRLEMQKACNIPLWPHSVCAIPSNEALSFLLPSSASAADSTFLSSSFTVEESLQGPLHFPAQRVC